MAMVIQRFSSENALKKLVVEISNDAGNLVMILHLKNVPDSYSDKTIKIYIEIYELTVMI